MKPKELDAILDGLDANALNKTVAHYRSVGFAHILFATLSVVIVFVAMGVIVVNIVLTPLFLTSSSVFGQLLIGFGSFIFMNGMFELANNFRAASVIELRKANLLRAKQKTDD